MWNSTNFVTPNWVDSVHFTSFQMVHFFGRERWWHVRMNPWSVFFNTCDTTQEVAWENYGKLMNMISNILKVFRQTHLKISPRWQRSRWTSEVGSIMAQAFQKVFAEMDAENPSGVTLEWLGAGKFLSYQEIANFHAALFLPEQPDKLTWPGGIAVLNSAQTLEHWEWAHAWESVMVRHVFFSPGYLQVASSHLSHFQPCSHNRMPDAKPAKPAKPEVLGAIRDVYAAVATQLFLVE